MDYTELFLKKMNTQGNAQNTIKAYESDIKQMLEIVNKDVKDIKAIDLLDKWSEYITTLEDTTRKRKIICIKLFFDFLVELDVIQKNPANILKTPKIKSKEVRFTPSDKEVESMIKTATNPKMRAIITVLANTGLRFGELKNMKLSDIKNNIVTVDGKTGKRKVPLNQESMKAIEEYLKVRKQGCDKLFVSDRGTELDNTSVYRMVRNLARKAKVEKWDECEVHCLRRYCISKAWKKGINPAIISKIFGNSLDVEAKHYIKIDDEDLINAVK